MTLKFLKWGLGAALSVALCACQTAPKPIEPSPAPQDNQTSNEAEAGQSDILDDELLFETPDSELPSSEPSSSGLPSSGTPESNAVITPPQNIGGPNRYAVNFSDYLAGWEAADLRPALAAFARNCAIWEKRSPTAALMTAKPEFGRYQDWQILCEALPPAPYNDALSRWFFESYFLPSNLLTADRLDGLLTGYYEPEIDVRAQSSGAFSEPILAKPDDEALRKKTRAEIDRTQGDYETIAYGRAIDVFFMQVQGSGRLRFADGRVKRAAYGGNNGYGYKSIGGVLIRRGEMTREQASKQAIEDWMTRAGPAAARSLMNENARYIYFGFEDIKTGEGPKGSMGVALTAMGSMAIDPKSRPYGTPVWLETTLPQSAGDYRGQRQSLLVIAQDSGNAIKGEARGDLFFGSGDLAGELAGVMKHDVHMVHLLPRSLVLPKLGFEK